MDFVNFDTFKFVSRLEQAGMSREQAAAVLEAQQAMFSHVIENTLATKRDIARLEKQMDALDVKFSSEIAKLAAELLLLKWMIGVLVALSVANFAKQFF
jgi:DNA-binding transcriptional MerR regulator